MIAKTGEKSPNDRRTFPLGQLEFDIQKGRHRGADRENRKGAKHKEKIQDNQIAEKVHKSKKGVLPFGAIHAFLRISVRLTLILPKIRLMKTRHFTIGVKCRVFNLLFGPYSRRSSSRNSKFFRISAHRSFTQSEDRSGSTGVWRQ